MPHNPYLAARLTELGYGPDAHVLALAEEERFRITVGKGDDVTSFDVTLNAVTGATVNMLCVLSRDRADDGPVIAMERISGYFSEGQVSSGSSDKL